MAFSKRYLCLEDWEQLLDSLTPDQARFVLYGPIHMNDISVGQGTVCIQNKKNKSQVCVLINNQYDAQKVRSLMTEFYTKERSKPQKISAEQAVIEIKTNLPTKKKPKRFWQLW